MDLLSISRALWRHKVASVLILVLTAGGAAYQLLARPAVYESTATLVLVAPPPPPTEQQLKAQPQLSTLNSDNPYTRVYDPGLIINFVSTFLDSDESRRALARQGADDRFEVTQTARYGFTSPVAEVRGVGSDAATAQKTAKLVVEAFRQRLAEIQKAEGVDRRYFVDVRRVAPPGPGKLQVSSKLRGLVAVVGLGAIALFMMISTADALQRARIERDQPSAPVLATRPPAQAANATAPARRPSAQATTAPARRPSAQAAASPAAQPPRRVASSPAAAPLADPDGGGRTAGAGVRSSRNRKTSE